jgi:hypothetical protein
MFVTPISVADLVLALEFQEVLELSNLTNPIASTINDAKVLFAIERAVEFIDSYYAIASDCGRAYIKLNSRQLQIWLTRYFLDSIKTRPLVGEDKESAIKILEYACSDCATNCPLSQTEISTILGTPLKKSKARLSAGTTYNYKSISKIYDSRI